MQCPECESKAVQKSSALYEQGVRTSEGKSSGGFVTSRGTIGVGTSRNQTRSSSLATERNAPPGGLSSKAMRAILISGAILFAAIWVSSSLWVAVLGAVALMGFVIHQSAPDDAQLAEELRWRHQWYCKKCGTMFFDSGAIEAEAPRIPKPTSWWKRTFGA